MAYLQSYVAPEGAEQEACSTGRLRSINVLLAAAFFVLMQQLHWRLHPQTGSETATLLVGCTPACAYVIGCSHACKAVCTCYILRLLAD